MTTHAVTGSSTGTAHNFQGEALYPFSHGLSYTPFDYRDLRHYEPELGDYTVDAGDHEVRIGASSGDVRLRERLTVTDAHKGGRSPTQKGKRTPWESLP